MSELTLIDESKLLEWTDYKQRADLRKWLIQQKIPFRLGKGGKICVVEYDLRMNQLNELIA
jgi:hypothetical protein